MAQLCFATSEIHQPDIYFCSQSITILISTCDRIYDTCALFTCRLFETLENSCIYSNYKWIIFNLINFSLNVIAVPHLQGYCKKSGRDFEKSKGQDYINDSMWYECVFVWAN